jgi:hypothetical protein
MQKQKSYDQWAQEQREERYGKYSKRASPFYEGMMPSSQFDILRAANDPKKLSKLGMSSEQMLQYGLNLKGARERESEMAMKLGGFGANIQAGGGYVGGFAPIKSAQQAYDISKDPEELRRRGISAREALKFGQSMLGEEEEEEGMRGSLSEMLSRQKQRKSGMAAFSPISQSSMIGRSFGSLMG